MWDHVRSLHEGRQARPGNVEELGRDSLSLLLKYTNLVKSAESFVLCSRTKSICSQFSTGSLYLMSCHSALPKSQEMCDGNPGGRTWKCKVLEQVLVSTIELELLWLKGNSGLP